MITLRIVTIESYCECGRDGLHDKVVVFADDMVKKKEEDLVLIARTCPNGPDAEDRLVLQRESYSLYETKREPIF